MLPVLALLVLPATKAAQVLLVHWVLQGKTDQQVLLALKVTRV